MDVVPFAYANEAIGTSGCPVGQSWGRWKTPAKTTDRNPVVAVSRPMLLLGRLSSSFLLNASSVDGNQIQPGEKERRERRSMREIDDYYFRRPDWCLVRYCRWWNALDLLGLYIPERRWDNPIGPNAKYKANKMIHSYPEAYISHINIEISSL